MRNVFQQLFYELTRNPVRMLDIVAALLEPAEVIQAAEHQECGQGLFVFHAERSFATVALQVGGDDIVEEGLPDLRQ